MMFRISTLRRTFLVVALICFSGSIFGNELDKNVAEFTKISMSVSGDIELVQNDEHRVLLNVVRGNQDELVIDVRRGELEITRDCGFGKRCTRPHLQVEGTIYFHSIDTLKMRGAGQMSAKDLTMPELEVSINGAGNVDIGAIDTEKIEFNVNGAGTVSIEEGEFDHFSTSINGAGEIAVKEGNTTSCEVIINGGGDFSGIGLKSAIAEVNVRGAGDVRVHASDELKVTIMGTGDVTYDGTPEVSSRILGTGNISKL